MPRQPVHRFWRSPALPFVESRIANDCAACYAPHSHNSLSIGAVDGGRSVLRHSNVSQPLAQGDVVLIPAGEVHACNPEEDGRWSYQMLYLDPAWVRDVVGEMGPFDALVLTHLPAHTAPQHLHTRLTSLNTCLFGAASLQDKEAALLLFVGDLFGSQQTKRLTGKPDSARLRDVQAMIQARCTEALTLNEMAAHACLSRYHFVRAFKRTVGITRMRGSLTSALSAPAGCWTRAWAWPRRRCTWALPTKAIFSAPSSSAWPPRRGNTSARFFKTEPRQAAKLRSFK